MERRHLPLVGRLGPNSVRAAVHRGASELLAERVSPRAMAEQLGQWSDEVAGLVREAVAPPAPLACGPGCTYCCHLKVTLTATDALALSEHLRATLPPPELARLKKRVREAHATTAGLSAEERAKKKLVCPLNGEGGLCVAFEVRPAACRGANSFDRSQCEAAFERPDDDLPVHHYRPDKQNAESFMAGTQLALAEARLDPRPLELVAALRVALETPDAKARYLRGEAVFEPAVDQESLGG